VGIRRGPFLAHTLVLVRARVLLPDARLPNFHAQQRRTTYRAAVNALTPLPCLGSLDTAQDIACLSNYAARNATAPLRLIALYEPARSRIGSTNVGRAARGGGSVRGQSITATYRAVSRTSAARAYSASISCHLMLYLACLLTTCHCYLPVSPAAGLPSLVRGAQHRRAEHATRPATGHAATEHTGVGRNAPFAPALFRATGTK